MRLFVATGEAGRICCTSGVGSVEHGDIELDFPDDFDFAAQGEYRIVDGELVHDPLGPSSWERIEELKTRLAETDYVVIKIAEAQSSGVSLQSADVERYEDIIEQRRAWRAEINSLEGEEVSE